MYCVGFIGESKGFNDYQRDHVEGIKLMFDIRLIMMVNQLLKHNIKTRE